MVRQTGVECSLAIAREGDYAPPMAERKAEGPNPRSLEARLRRTLERRGYALAKSRVRDPLALEYGKYYVSDSWTRLRVFVGSNLEAVERWVAKMEKRPDIDAEIDG